jgi:hypothetical protein
MQHRGGGEADGRIQIRYGRADAEPPEKSKGIVQQSIVALELLDQRFLPVD